MKPLHKRMPEDWDDRDAAAEYLSEVIAELSMRVRDDNPFAVQRWLRNHVPASEMESLVLLLAAHVPVDVALEDLTAWFRPVSAVPLSGRRSA